MMLFLVSCLDAGERVLSGKSFASLQDAEMYASTISPSRVPWVLFVVADDASRVALSECVRDVDVCGWCGASAGFSDQGDGWLRCNDCKGS